VEEVKRMKRNIAISGGLLIVAMIIISGSAVATSYYVIRVDSQTSCTSASNILYTEDGSYATIGQNPSTLGEIIIDFGVGTGMEDGDPFTIFADSIKLETYKIRLINDATPPYRSSWWTGQDDTTDVVLYAPDPGSGRVWRYVEIHSENGDTSDDGDTIYGSDIDAVGFDHI
jgi:hypothetical protein